MNPGSGGPAQPRTSPFRQLWPGLTLKEEKALGPPHPLALALILLPGPALGRALSLSGVEVGMKPLPSAHRLPVFRGSGQRAGMAHGRATALPAWDPCRLPVSTWAGSACG